MDNLQRDIGRLEGSQAAMKDQIEQMADDIKEMKEAIDHLVSIVDQGKGSLRTLFTLGTIAASIGAAVAWLVGLWHR